jgi:hypothetical protein
VRVLVLTFYIQTSSPRVLGSLNIMTETVVTCISKLNDRNYSVWALQSKFAMMNKGCWSAIDPGTDVSPAIEQKAKSMIGMTVEDHLLPLVDHAKSAKEAWDTFKARYVLNSASSRLHLRRDLNSLKMEGAETMSMYFARARRIRDDLVAIGDHIDDDQVAMSILAGLPKQYDTVITVMQHGNQKLSLDTCLANLLPMESKLQRAEEEESVAVAHTAKFNKGKPKKGLWNNSRDSDERTCFYCGEKGHIKMNCPTRKADLKEFEEQRMRERGQRPMVTFAAAY